MTDEELCEISLAYGFGPAVLVGGTSAVAAKPERLLPMLREIERRTLERAKQLCEARAERAGTKTMLGYGVHIGAHHCAVEIDEAIRALLDAQSGEEQKDGR